MAVLTNPGLPGSFSFDTVIYASAGSNYGGVPALSQYTIYDTPDPAYLTPRINISVFANLGIGAPVALSEHERAAQRACLHPARTRAVPARRVRARQSRSSVEFDAGLSVPVLVARVARHRRGHDRR